MEREEALAKGLQRYSTGRPCLNGHFSERNAKSAQCLECVRTGPRVRRWGRSGDPEKAKVRAGEWRDRNPRKLKYVQWANAVNTRKTVGRVSYADLIAKMADQDGLCRYCRTELDDKAQLDHILPVVYRGTSWPWNLQFLCYDCHREKNWHFPLEFEYEKGFWGDSWIALFQPGSIRKSSMICEAV